MGPKRYPKRLIEVDLPIKRISEHARREKSIRHGHISTLHIWWARRPLAACRAVVCAALWPDPADPLCPASFRRAAVEQIRSFAAKVLGSKKLQEHCSPESAPRWVRLAQGHIDLSVDNPAHLNALRYLLLDFIADFANWDNSTVPEFLETSRALTQAAHEALGGEPGTRPLVVDPFAGGGSIPLEALRVGADAFASDLNPVAVLLNKVVLEYIPKYGQKLADEVRKWGQWIKEEAEKELAQFYPKDPDGATPIAYLWARTIICEGPGCGAEVPLMRSLWLAKKKNKSVALRLVPDQENKRVGFEIFEPKRASEVGEGTVRRGAGTCPVCGYTTPVESVRKQLKARRGGADDARMFCVVTTRPGEKGRFYRLPEERDLKAVEKAKKELERRKGEHKGELSLVPDEEISLNELRRISVPLYGMSRWGDLFSDRQALTMNALLSSLKTVDISRQVESPELEKAIITCLAIMINRQADASSSMCRWHTTRELHTATFGRQAIGMVWDFSEVSPFSGSTGGFDGAMNWVLKVLEGHPAGDNLSGQVERASATEHPLPSDSVAAFISDPPYYDSVPYSHLSDYFYVWLKRALVQYHPLLFAPDLVEKEKEIVVDRPHSLSTSKKDIEFYEFELGKAFSEGRRVVNPNGIGTVVFASKTTTSWEAILNAMVNAGWIITASWPIDSEMTARVAAQGQARLASSIHLVCRPRENPDGSLRQDIGDWRDVLSELPGRISEWMDRLTQEGVVGADAIFACLGPALEIFSRYSKVEKASGEEVSLREYLEYVWAAVAKEALSKVFQGADATGFEEDARLTAMWLWTLKTEANGNGTKPDGSPKPSTGYTLEYDAARKIAQGLGAHLEKLAHLVEVKGDKARLLPASERAGYLFGKEGIKPLRAGVKPAQEVLFKELDSPQALGGAGTGQAQGEARTVLDRVHQAMLLFASGRGEALKRFLVDDGIGKDERFWRLADALSPLYPAHSEEKRWVDGVLARKRGLGL